MNRQGPTTAIAAPAVAAAGRSSPRAEGQSRGYLHIALALKPVTRVSSICTRTGPGPFGTT